MREGITLAQASNSLSSLPLLVWLAPIGAIVALIMARGFAKSVMQRPEGEPEMVRIAEAVRQGAMAYLKRQYRVVALVFVLLVGLLALSAWLGLQPALSMIGVPIAGLFSGICGWLGMRTATNASARTAFAAKQSLNDGLTVAFRSGAVMGLNVVGFALLDASVWFLLLNSVGPSLGLSGDIRELTTIMLSFAMGASTQALFARVGGGIYTKAADVGADLVGKVEAGIPEDDPRNPATIADNVGDNVGDVAGMGADLYESYYGSILATMALGAAAAFTLPGAAGGEKETLATLLAAAPLLLAGVGILCSIAGIFVVRAREDASFAQLLKSLHSGVWVASAMIAALSFAALFFLLGKNPLVQTGEHFRWWGLGLSIVSGLVAGLVIASATEYFTSYEHAPTRRISIQALTGPATVIIGGVAEGMKSTWVPLITVVVAVLASFAFAGGAQNFLMGLYGVSIAAVGMLATLGITLATDAYGPIADNAGGNAEMSGQPAFVRQRTDMLDSLGNTTAATGKGFAIGSAALTALALFAAYIQVVQTQLTTQAVSRMAPMIQSGQAADAAAMRPGNAMAYYLGDHRFAVYKPLPGGGSHIDCALIVDRVQLLGTHFEETVKVGQVFAVKPLPRFGEEATHDHEEHEGDDHQHADEPTIERARRFVVSAEIAHGEHAHEYAFELIGTRNGALSDVATYYDISLTNPKVLGGVFIGVLLAFLFCALTMSAVGRAAYAMMQECRRQFSRMRQALRASGLSESEVADPETWPKRITHDGAELPDYARCVSIATAGAQREMIVPALLAIVVPLLVGLALDVPGVVGLLAGGLTSGFAVAIFMANAGGAWDNAKKLIESFGRMTADDFLSKPELRERVPAEIREALLAKAEELQRLGRGTAYVYGKGSDDHKATVVGDTVGDPFKDTSGPSLNILIKLISIVSVVFAGLIVKYGPALGGYIGLS